MDKISERLGELGVIPVVTIDDVTAAVDLGRALVAANLPCAEITFRTDAAEGALRSMANAHPEIVIGAGTVLTIEQAERAIGAGAKFIVTPGFDAAVVDYCLEQAVPIVPGVMTPTEINMALNKGLRLLKFFPAEAAGGIKALKAIGGPYVGVNFIPTGGINPANLADYLGLPMVHACGGSWMVGRQLIAAGEFDRIEQLAAEAVALVSGIRSG